MNSPSSSAPYIDTKLQPDSRCPKNATTKQNWELKGLAIRTRINIGTDVIMNARFLKAETNRNEFRGTATIQHLQEESTIPDYAFNLFCFIHTPDQEEVQVKGTPSAEDIVTGFKDQSEAQLRQYLHQFLAQRGTMGQITRVWFAVLDSLSAAQSMIVLHHSMGKSLWDETHAEVPETPIPGQYEICDDGNIWWKWRVPFRYAWTAWNSISSCDLEVLELYSRPEYLGLDGVVDAETCDQILNGIFKDPRGLV